MKKNILLLETIDDEALSLLKKQVNIFTGYTDLEVKEALAQQPMHAIITRGKGQINKQLIDACPNLEVVARCGVGLDNVDIQEATARKISVIHAPASNAITMAEHTIGLMLMLKRNLYESVIQVKNNNWNWRNQYSGDELHGKTLGIVGMGNIGQRVAKLGDALGMTVCYTSPSKKDVPYEQLSLENLLKQADVISLHLPYNQQTAVLIGAQQLALMKSNALLINTARGALVDHIALEEALNKGQIAGYAADVLPQEPPEFNDAIIMHPNTLITPHSGSLTATTYRQMCVYTVTNVLAQLHHQNAEIKSIYNYNDLQQNDN